MLRREIRFGHEAAVGLALGGDAAVSRQDLVARATARTASTTAGGRNRQ
jgi:hypothetical protein